MSSLFILKNTFLGLDPVYKLFNGARKKRRVVKAKRDLVWSNFVSPVSTWKNSINRSKNSLTVT